jgi:hypothetical protein
MEQPGQFQIIFLESEAETASHSLPGPLGMGVTSSVPGLISDYSSGEPVLVQILPHPNEQQVDPKTLKSA